MEVAVLLFAGISAVMASIQVWQRTRDSSAAAQEFDREFNRAQYAPETLAAAEELLSIAPTEVIEDLENRADECWVGYRKVLGGDYLPEEIDKASDSVKHCVCRELWRIHKINGGRIPFRWKKQWDAYACARTRRFPGFQWPIWRRKK